MNISGDSRHLCIFVPPHKNTILCFKYLYSNVLFTVQFVNACITTHISSTHPSQNLLGEFSFLILNWKLWWHTSAPYMRVIFLQIMSTCKILMSICKINMSTCNLFMSTCNLFMSTCKIIMLTCKIIMLTCKIFMSTCNLFMCTCKIIMLTCKIIMLTYNLLCQHARY